VIIVVGYFQIRLSSKINSLNEKVAATETELKKYKAVAKNVDTIKRKLANLHKRTDVMIQLDKNRKEPIQLLESMTELVVPERMWLTNLQSTGKTVKISGVALDNKTTADFMTRLERSELFSNVNLRTLKHKVQKKQKLKSFNITCTKASKKQKKPQVKNNVKSKAKT
jgi:type IV pilus assembly protein PilN